MKRTLCLILAILMLCTFPALFASDDFDLPEHDHDHECELCEAGGASLMGEWGDCPICQITTWQQLYSYPNDVYVDAGDGGHWAITYGYIDCLECGATIADNVYIGEAWEEHFWDHTEYDQGNYIEKCICEAIIGR